MDTDKDKIPERLPNNETDRLDVHLTDQDLQSMEKSFEKTKDKTNNKGSLDKEISDHAEKFAMRWESCGFKPLQREAAKDTKNIDLKQKELQGRIKSIIQERLSKYDVPDRYERNKEDY
jgi:hypothetical protein